MTADLNQQHRASRRTRWPFNESHNNSNRASAMPGPPGPSPLSSSLVSAVPGPPGPPLILKELGMVGAGARELIVAEYRVTGLSPTVIAELVAEVGPLWHHQHQARLTARPRRRAVGAGVKHKFVYVDRLLVTLVNLRHGTTHDVLACWFGVDRAA
ncbi:transposase family protein [Streptomyces sp. NPDC005811]|uniref:transposase family protein n=1 Tax=Streptomyces sp. NPDC005811 TaxID=3154565 RepID=UPI0033DE08E3